MHGRPDDGFGPPAQNLGVRWIESWNPPTFPERKSGGALPSLVA